MSQNSGELAGATQEPDEPEVSQVREIAPVVFFDKSKGKQATEHEEQAALYDFRPVQRAAQTQGETVPKAVSSAQESAASSESPTVTETESSENTETPVPVEKDSTNNKESESGMPDSSSKTSAGKSKQTA